MRQIMFISSNYPPRIGGPATTVPQLAKNLSKKYNIAVIAFKEKNTKAYEKNQFEVFRSPAFYNFGFSNPISVAIRVVLLSLFSKIILLKKNAVLIHAFDAHISAIAALFCKYTSIKKIKVVIKYAGDTMLESSNLNNNKNQSFEEILKKMSFKQKLVFSLQKIIFNLSDYVHVHNKYQENIIKKVYKIPNSKILFLSNPIDTQKFSVKRKTRNKKIKLLISSRLVPWKCPELVIKSIDKIYKKSNVELNIIGEGQKEYVQKLINLAKKSTVKINFLGKIDNNKIAQYYKNHSVLIQASTYEPFSNTVLESLSCGTPVLASKTGGNIILIKPGLNGFLFKVNNEKDFIKKINILIKSIDKFDPKKVKDTIKKYEITAVCKEFEKKYEQTFTN